MFSFYPELTGNPPRYALGARRSPNTSDLSTRKHWWVLFTLSKSLFDHSRRLHINLSSNQAAEGLKWKCHQACFQLNALPKRPVHQESWHLELKDFTSRPVALWSNLAIKTPYSLYWDFKTLLRLKTGQSACMVVIALTLILIILNFKSLQSTVLVVVVHLTPVFTIIISTSSTISPSNASIYYYY